MDEKRATNLEEVWLFFDPYTPLEANSKYYIERLGNALQKLQRWLLRDQPAPKYFYSGHRGAGKSTELNRLVVDDKIRDKYIVIHYRISDCADPMNLSHVDIIFSLGTQIFFQYTDSDTGYGKKLPKTLLAELEGWRGRIEDRVKTVDKKVGASAEANLNAFFLKALAWSKAEESSRVQIRQILEPRLSELISTINLMVSAIAAQEKKQVLVIIDDLDKPPLDKAKEVFYGYHTILMQPVCGVIYTVPSAIFFAPEYAALREQSFFLPNVKLHRPGKPNEKLDTGYATMREFFSRRASRRLIDDAALETAATASGGVFREYARLIRTAADLAIEANREQISLIDVNRAEAELRNEFTHFLTPADYQTLREIEQNPHFKDPERLSPLLHNLAALEYHNDQSWYGVHPALLPLIRELNGNRND
ncbi:Type II secretory pathway, ATPase PulE/Tfp pilus assembly pathway, ATPase PilB [hydrothermal vent metagenome]|uniref:Type II secretory pathway, ATPase PulE/Tfp pilus assembly pathway, ATPase PilB n=1 Tax=hydrothermal vent metagenome TaxID=652676 RepID=A0A3B0V3B4_9ZZZZ